jgi:hypothetical protein
LDFSIHDFEFTPECAIFDLFDIGLVHGWLIDPQVGDTFNLSVALSTCVVTAFHSLQMSDLYVIFFTLKDR